MLVVPSPVWLLTVYSMDVLSRLAEVKARVTSVFRSILKMDSTKKVTKKLAGYASDTAAWATNVGNEHGHVLNHVLTAGEGEGLMKRYQLAGVPPPQLMYVDRDCCSSFGGSKTASMFPEWDQLVVRFDIWHLLRRFVAGVTTESHQLYRAFMRFVCSPTTSQGNSLVLSTCTPRPPRDPWRTSDFRRPVASSSTSVAARSGASSATGCDPPEAPEHQDSPPSDSSSGSEDILFLVSLSFVYFAKAFGGSYMKSSITQIERRFDIPSSLIGFIDGSFEMGNLLVIAFVSYFGAKLHRPRLIGIGCLIMAAGAFLTALPHFFQGKYVYETTLSHTPEENTTESILPCLANTSHLVINDQATAASKAACEKEAGSSMWIYVFLVNMLRGIGETPVMLLGVSYLDDYARKENNAIYLACLQTVGILGPVFGFTFGAFCAKIYVDIGSVNLESISINHKDSRWVGAWWLGFLVSGFLMLLAGIPFWFLPNTLPKQGKSPSKKKQKEDTQAKNSSDTQEEEQEQGSFLPEDNTEEDAPKPVTMAAMAKEFGPSLKRLLLNKVYLLIILTSVVAFNGFIGMITFKPKFMEQVYGQSPSKAIFLIGSMNLPAVGIGVIVGGYVMKRFKLSILGAARLSISSFLSFCLLLIQYFLQCENSEVAGLTMTYKGAPEVSYQQESLLSQCNMGCSCSLKHWDPVCASNGMTYASPCLAGCQTSIGVGKEMEFHYCTCMGELKGKMLALPTNMSVILGQCPRKSDCDRMFKFYMAVSVLGAFVSDCGGTSGYIVLLRSIHPDLKSLALGMQTLIVRTLGGILPPIYFGALIDRTSLKWGLKRCGGQGACRLYDSHAFRITFLGLIYGLYSLAYLLWGVLYWQLSKRQKKLVLRSQAKATALEANGNNNPNGHAMVSIFKNKDDLDRDSESTI
ncbi:solute carrier organic anion transporter family member 1C1-like [Coregonus clupeaformis]|uniref:solute carrier organic anion transporter family member 1C1-like n=1 Tax=Coregonus clupeaformis TaxID=59861 RepID=UPI001BE05D48|nr:solute carrier organic anion transporter family member 1C1-like [Coregonus clupeaformis]